ncbi:MAG: DUF992 domain-containing protein [Pseudomonadota bacterium]
MRLAPTVLTAALVVALPLAGHATTPKAEKTLQPIGSLSCTGSRAAEETQPTTTKLECEMRLQAAAPGARGTAFTGEVVGTDLWLVKPGSVELFFTIFAPTREVAAAALAGDYDLTTRQNFASADGSGNRLYGGDADAFALELTRPGGVTMNASTKLTLTEK